MLYYWDREVVGKWSVAISGHRSSLGDIKYVLKLNRKISLKNLFIHKIYIGECLHVFLQGMKH
jgi:hypothetical protein